MSWRARVPLLIAGTLLAVVPDAIGQYYGDPTPPPSTGGNAAVEVDANGDPFMPGSLNFDPAEVSVKVGQVVRWTNTDAVVPHTATEDHGLWRLSGTYGSPGPAQGFGPGDSVERAFEAGTHHYYCEVHPEQMKGVVKVPVSLKRVRHRRARAQWSTTAAADGLVFDVERRRGHGRWKRFRTATKAGRARFALGRAGTRWSLRARLRSSTDPAKATGWSPVASLRG